MDTNEQPLLEVKDLTVEIPGVLGERQIGLRRVSLSLSPREILVLAGETGSGKSLLARLASGTADPRVKVLAGSLRVCGEEFPRGRRNRFSALRRGPVTVVTNAAAAPPDPGRTVRQWLREVRRLARGREAARDWGDVFFNAGLLEPETLLPRSLVELSALERARLAVVRAILLDSRLLISEEVSADLDPLAEDAWHELLGRVRDEFGIGILVTTGTLRGVGRFANRVAVFFEGGLLESGPPAAILTNPQFAYTGEFRSCAPGLAVTLRDLPTISRSAVREAEDFVHRSATSLQDPESATG
jgi:ABC-type glutathione transport system ATPase component